MKNAVEPDPAASRLLAEFLASRDSPCPRCGYNLRGVASGRCPECGDGLTLLVGLVEPRMAAFVSMVVASSLGLGGGGLFGLIALRAAPGNWWNSVCGTALLVLIALSAVILPLVLLARRRIRRRSRLAQWCLAAGIWLITLTLFVVVLLTFDD